MCGVFCVIACSEHGVSPLLELAHINVLSWPITVISCHAENHGLNSIWRFHIPICWDSQEAMSFCLRGLCVFLDILQMAHFSRIMWTFLLYLPQAVCQMVLLRATLCEEYSANSHTLQFTPPDRFRFKGLAHWCMKNQLFKSYSSMYLIVLLRFEQILGCHGYTTCLDVFTHMTDHIIGSHLFM